MFPRDGKRSTRELVGSCALPGIGECEGRLIVIAAHEKVDPVVADQVDQPMLLRDPARPHVGTHVAQRFGLADPAEGVARDGFDQVKHTECDPAVSFDPEAMILAEFILERG